MHKNQKRLAKRTPLWYTLIKSVGIWGTRMEDFEDFTEAMREKEKNNVFVMHNHIEMVSVEKNKAVFKLDIRPESKNSFGMVHGGAIYAMADNAAGFATHTDGRHHVTQTSALHFLHNQSEGTVTATALVRHRGKTTTLVAVDITGDNGKLIATGEFTFYCVDKSLIDQKLKP